PGARAFLDALEELDVLLNIGRDIHRLLDALEEDPVTGVEGYELELLLRTRVEELVEVVEDLGHEVPRRPRIEAKPIPLPAARPAADLVATLEKGNGVAVAGQKGRARETRDTA